MRKMVDIRLNETRILVPGDKNVNVYFEIAKDGEIIPAEFTPEELEALHELTGRVLQEKGGEA